MPEPLDKADLFPAFEFLGHEVSITPNLFFRVRGPEFDAIDVQFESRRAALQEIQRRAHQSSVGILTDLRPSRDVINSAGYVFSITRINPVTGRIAGLESSTHVFPFVPWIETAVRRQIELENEIASINEKLTRLKIAVKRHDGPIAPRNLPWHNRRLEIELYEKHAFATKQTET